MLKRRLMFGICTLFLLTGLLFTFSMVNPAQAAGVKVLVDGKALSMDVKPVLENGRTLVPLRAIFEALGAKVGWDGKTRTVTAVKGSTNIKLVMDNITAVKNGEKVKLDVPAKIRNGRTLVPLRFVSEALGAKVDWNAATYTVTIARKVQLITITDSQGRTVQVHSPPKRVVVINSDVGELICALGAADKVVGVADTTDFPPVLKDKPKVGHSFRPSVEKIVELKPDIVFGYGKFLKEELAKQIESAGIAVVYLDCYQVKTMDRDIKTLGTILGKEKEAEEYVAFFNKYLKMFEDRIKKIKPEEKTLVYLEGYGDYKTVSAGSGGAQLLEMAGGNNIAADEPVAYPQISPEWVLSKNPQIIIKAASVTTTGPSGYGETSEAMKKQRDEIMSRPGWKGIDAVKNGRVYVISSEIYTSPRGPVGIAYFAKWLYPKLFADLDPDAIHRDFLNKFHGLKAEGTWVYPGGK